MVFSRAVSSAALAAVCCFAVLAVVQYKGEYIKVSGDDAAPELNVLKNIIDAKAYCLAAYDSSNVMIRNHPNLAAIADFVHNYGIDGGGDDVNGRKAHVDNIVTEYAHIMGALKAKYGHGVNMYILDHIDKAIRQNPEGLVNLKLDMSSLGGGGNSGRVFGHMAYINYEAIGLTDMPSIVTELATKYSKFLTFKSMVDKQAENADVVAATMFLQSKSFGHYTGFLQREVAKVEKKMRELHNFVAKSSFDAEQSAFEESYNKNRQEFFDHVAVQAPAAMAASETASAQYPWNPPTVEELKAKAQEAAKKFMADFQKSHGDPSSLLRRITEEVGGVKLFITTGTVTDATSTMKPSITIKGKNSELTKEIRAVPAAGSMMVQHLPAKEAIGDIKSVILTGTGAGLKWNVAGLKIRSGGVDANIHSFTTGKPETFWLKSGETVELFPVATPEAQVGDTVANHCQGFKATMQCDGKGTRDKESDKTCGEDIDSSLSGFCQCASGAAKSVDCGHDTFSCEEICKIMD